MLKVITSLLFILILLLNSNYLLSQVLREWTHRYTGPEASADEPTEVVADNSGNIYLTGHSIVGGDYYKFITVKFNSSGIRQWVAKYNGPAFSNSRGSSVSVDNSGNVYVTGNTRIGSGQIDLLLIKYDQNGIQQWVKQYNGPGNFDDFGISTGLDDLGNVYVGGYSYGGMSTTYDYVILKYSSSGSPVWTRRWNGSTNKEDYLKKIKVAGDGSVIGGGYSYKTTTSNDYATVKYDSSGNLSWASIYNSIYNGDDQGLDVKVDVSGNVYVCGQSKGAGIGNDFATVKYNSSGTELWVQRYDSPSANDDVARSLDVDVSGNIIVTGYSYLAGTLNDFATVKYSPSGVLQWIRNFNGDNLSDKAVSVSADVSGNIYVTGSSTRNTNGSADIKLIKYDVSGNELWIKTYNGPGNLDDNPVSLTLNAFQEPIVIGNSYSYFFSALCGSSDYLALKFSTSGDMEIETRYDGSGQGVDESRSIFTDALGNSYITGPSYDKISDYDYATLKYSPTGAPLWAARYDGGNNGIDRSVSVAADPFGNVYVTGTSRGSSGNNDLVTIKYNSSGSYQWEARYNGSANGDDEASELKVDALGNSFVTGYSTSSGSSKDYVTIKYSAAGVQQWASKYNGTGNADDFSKAIVIDNAGNSFVTGKSTGSGTSQDFCTVKYNSSGVQQWASVFNASANDSDEAVCLASDSGGNVIVAGMSKSTLTGFDIQTVKYNSSGIFQWSRSSNGTSAGSIDEAVSVACDSKGNIVVSGNSNNSVSGFDYTTIKYNTSGSEIWKKSYNGSMNETDKASSVYLDQGDNIYVTGFTKEMATGMSFTTIKYSKNGTLAWSDKYNYIDNDSDKASSLQVDASGNVYVTGFSTSVESKRDFFTVKYNQNYVLSAKLFIEGFYDQGLNQMIPDSVKLLLRNAAAPYDIADSSVSLVDNSGNGNFTFTKIQNGTDYFIVADHRNSIETWSAAGQSFQSNVLEYDFTVSVSQAYGNNLILKGTKYCVFSGDVNKDDIVDLTDLVEIFNKSSVFTSGYDAADVNGDQIVDLTDLIVTYNNAKQFVSVIRP